MLLVGYSITDWTVYNQRAIERSEQTMFRVSGLMELGLQNVVDHNDRIQMRDFLELMVNHPMVQGISFSLDTQDGAPISMKAGSFNEKPDSSLLRALTALPGIEEKVVKSTELRGPLSSREKWVANVQVHLDVDELYKLHEILVIRIFVIFLLMCFAVACLAVIFHHRIHKPILVILKSMRALKHSDYGFYRELQPVGQVDLDNLISGFNLYQSSLREAHEAQLKQISHLDRIVSEKTSHLQVALEKSHASEKAQQQIFQMMSLDLKQIIVACQFQIETLRRHTNFQYDQETVGQIARLGQEMTNTYDKLEQILAYSVTQAQSPAVVIEKVDLYREFEMILDKLGHQAYMKGLCLDLLFDPSLPSGIEVSKDGLRQIMSSMLSAAINNAVAGCITFELSKGEDILEAGFYLHLDVKCKITPLTPEALHTLRNAATHGVVSDKGLEVSSLSLHIALSRLREMAAFFEIESTTSGTHATIKMPVLYNSSAVSMDKHTVMRATRGKNLLFIVPDTSPVFCKGIMGRLTYLGQTVLSATNAEDVRVIVEQHPEHKTVLVGKRLSSLVMRENFASIANLRATGLSCILSLESKSLGEDDLDLPANGAPDVIQDSTVQMRTLINRVVTYCYPSGDHVHGIFIQQSPFFEEKTLKDFKILLIDDSTSVLDGMSEYLRNYGAEVITARSAQEGIDLAKSMVFDAICTDISMPQMSGIEVGFEIRQTSMNSKTPIVAMTAAVLSDQEMSDISMLNMTILKKNGIMDSFTATFSTLIRKARSEDEPVVKTKLHLVDSSSH
jgi:two-component system sensor histidine kinase BarA